ncbi:hypothetical protein [Tumebacillus flagellatus]|uniref:hypothetical protein n=1 Tax=Tumebacillus flagellatus TaxID=1157490 RepID=UPI001378E6DC|nr:hypothetical protein [Tumebacillus flagellatus]
MKRALGFVCAVAVFVSILGLLSQSYQAEYVPIVPNSQHVAEYVPIVPSIAGNWA